MPRIADGKYVVVGAAGLLGTHLGRQLLDAGAREVVLMDNLALGVASNLQDVLTDPRARFVRADMMRLNELHDPFEGADGVFLVAAVLGEPMLANPWMGLDVNVRGTQNVLEAARQAKAAKVVFSSSIGIYGTFAGGPEEDAPSHWQKLPHFVQLYAGSKIIGEGLCAFYKDAYGLDYLALRYGQLYGDPAHRRSLAGSDMAKAYDSIRAGTAPVIQGNGEQVQDYVYASDVARANILAMESEASGEALNIVSGVDTTTNRVVEIITEACGSDLVAEHAIDPTKGELPRVPAIGFTGEKAKRLIGWEAQVSVEEGLRRTVEWFDREDAH
ncbi:NAD-dependent epimerase/dehydratase family protein [Microbacterium sp. No. 7]|uniref:NAD-dependent epimerase/dehydratase family protein n=1 Tax=Microbacterium sp. No. 7 TaxID=1714373 RepID=UPI0006D16221|nr:NAD-dependent epimerase/dehydratase family protein [Microbacterium sp. No. 7]ALJ19295.1 hypothetical protein AOA12_05000 [Microbacterium sp. No. 7]